MWLIGQYFVICNTFFCGCIVWHLYAPDMGYFIRFFYMYFVTGLHYRQVIRYQLTHSAYIRCFSPFMRHYEALFG